MKPRLPTGLIIVAALQFVPPLIVAPATLRTVSPVIWAAIVIVFGLLGVNLLRRQAWSRVATVFLQGFSIIVRLLVLVGNATVGTEVGAPVDVPLVTTSVLSMLLSAAILYYIDLPDVQMAMQ